MMTEIEKRKKKEKKRGPRYLPKGNFGDVHLRSLCPISAGCFKSVRVGITDIVNLEQKWNILRKSAKIR
jgi:hypothetical protein